MRNGASVYLIPDNNTPFVHGHYIGFKDQMAVNLAARYLILEGWVEYAGGAKLILKSGETIAAEPTKEVLKLIESV